MDTLRLTLEDLLGFLRESVQKVCRKCAESYMQSIKAPDLYRIMRGQGLILVPPAGFEPATNRVEAGCSNPLSYGGEKKLIQQQRMQCEKLLETLYIETPTIDKKCSIV